MRSSALIIVLALFSSSILGATISKDSRCGDDGGGTTCPSGTNGVGLCCSQSGWCGSTSDYCLPTRGCQPDFGKCSPSPVLPTLRTSTDGRCGTEFSQTCQNSAYGNCCSTFDYCGKVSAYCGWGCQPQFGTCSKVFSSRSRSSSAASSTKISTKTSLKTSTKTSMKTSTKTSMKTSIKTSAKTSAKTSTKASTRSSTAKNSSPTKPISTNARCGAGFGGQTCKGSKWGKCCNKSFYCGNTAAYCGLQNCLKDYGDCNLAA